jgi:hypothetical protein
VRQEAHRRGSARIGQRRIGQIHQHLAIFVAILDERETGASLLHDADRYA